MAVNLTFWYLPEEEPHVLGALVGDPTLLAAPLLLPEPLPSPFPTLVDHLRERDPARLFVLRPDDLARLVLVPVEGGLGIHAMLSPVLQLTRSQRRADGALGQASLSAYLQLPDGTPKSPGFVRWAERVLSRVRKQVPGHQRYRSYRSSAGVDAAVLEGLELVY